MASDRAALAARIDRLLVNDALRTRLGQQARRHVEARFDLRKQTLALENLYDDVVSRARRPSRGVLIARPVVAAHGVATRRNR